jgi:uncharacterized protein YecE (DUF72 family)
LLAVMGSIHIGTSGWNYKHWIGRFYPQGLPQAELLSFYAKYFDTVEVNNSFYQLPKLHTFTNWRKTVPADFRFAVKASRFITHMKKLKAPRTSSQKLFTRIERLRGTLGPILFQLPPHWRCDEDRLARYLDSLSATHQYAFEFRDSSWLTESVYALLKQHNVAFCIHDFRGTQTPSEITADFTYIRMHGPHKAAYSGSYSAEALQRWAQDIKDWRKHLKDIYVYFNNDVEGHAVTNALQLRELCGKN